MRCRSSSRAGVIVATVSRQLRAGADEAVAICFFAPATDAFARCAEAMFEGAKRSTAPIAQAMGPDRMVMAVVGFEGGTIAISTQGTGIDSMQRTANACRSPARVRRRPARGSLSLR